MGMNESESIIIAAYVLLEHFDYVNASEMRSSGLRTLGSFGIFLFANELRYSFKDGLFTAATDDPKWQVAHRVLISPFSVRGALMLNDSIYITKIPR